MAHAHPLSDAIYLPAQQSPHSAPSRPKYTLPATTSTPTRYFHSPQQSEISPHNRRLQLRNAGFRGPVLPARRVTPFTVVSPPIQESFTFAHPGHDENTPSTVERRSLYGEHLPPSPVSILQEINNTSHRKRQSPKPVTTTIFQDSTATMNPGNTSATSWYNESTNTPSPSLRGSRAPKMMKLQEGSLNEKTAKPTGLKLPKLAKELRKSRKSSRSSEFEATKYIEHLESELASLGTKIDAITSPTRTKAQSTKLRALTNETRALREEVSEWEKRFEERVADEIQKLSFAEAGLKIDIKALEGDTEGKNIKIQELERELDNARGKLEDMESLTATNQSLERRVDVLTELLAQSPTRDNSSRITSTLGIVESTKCVPRPKSLLLPRILSSHNTMRFSTGHIAENTSWHNKNRTSMSTSSISETPEDEIQSPLDMEAGMLDSSLCAAQSMSQISCTDDATSRFVMSSSSRPTSMTSNSSFNSSWGLPISAPQCEEPKSTGRPRRMRRFLSGSCSLKPLILPVSTTVTPSFPMSAPVCSSNDIPSRECSNNSIDPTIAFLSRAQESSPFTTPTQLPRQTSASQAQKQALDALEGKLSWPINKSGLDRMDFDCAIETCEQEYTCAEEAASPASPKPQRRSLQMELEQAQRVALERGTMSPAVDRNVQTADAQTRQGIRTMSPYTRNSSSPSGLQIGRDAIHDSQQQALSSNTTESPNSSHPQMVFPCKTVPTSASILTTTFGLFSKLTDLIKSMKQDPLILARRIVINSWAEGSSRLGGLGWWLLGLIFRSRQRKQDSMADPKIVEEGDSKDIDRPILYIRADKTSNAQPSRQSSERYSVRRGNTLGLQSDDISGTRRSIASSHPSFFGLHNEKSKGFSSPCQDCVEPPSRRTLRLWLKFTLAIVLAVGVAVKDGPGTLLEDLPPRDDNGCETNVEESDSCTRACQGKFGNAGNKPISVAPRHPACSSGLSQAHTTMGTPGGQPTNLNEGNSGWDYTFAEVLGPADFATKT